MSGSLFFLRVFLAEQCLRKRKNTQSELPRLYSTSPTLQMPTVELSVTSTVHRMMYRFMRT